MTEQLFVKVIDYKPSDGVPPGFCDHGPGCLQIAFRQAGIDIGNGAFVREVDIGNLTYELNILYFANHSTIYSSYFPSQSCIVLENSKSPCVGHATFFKSVEEGVAYSIEIGSRLAGIIVI